MGSLLPQSLGLRCEIELFRKRQARKGKPQAPRLGQSDTEVLDEMVDFETWLEVTPDCPGPVVGERPRSRSPFANRLEHALDIQSRSVRVQQRFADADHPGRDRNLIDHLGVLSR